MSTSSFDLSTKSFVQITADNRVHLWDIATGKEKRSYVDKHHLSHNFTCFCTKSSGKDHHLGLAAVGFSDSVITVWDFARGVVVKTLGLMNESPVPTALAFSNDGSSVYVCSDSEEIVEYSVSTGEVIRALKGGKKGVNRVAVNPKAEVLAVSSGSSIKLLDVASGQKRKLEGSFQGGCSTLTFSTCGTYLVATSSRSKEILVFDVQAEASSSPVVVIPVLAAPVSISVRSDKKARSLEILSIFEQTGASVYHIVTTGDMVVQESKLVFKGNIVAAAFGSMKGKREAGSLLAVGSDSQLTFVHVETKDSLTGSVLSSVDVNALPALLEFAADGGEATHGRAASTIYSQQQEALVSATVLGPNETGGSKRPIVALEGDNENTASKRRTTQGDDELTLEQQLEQLSRNISEVEAGDSVAVGVRADGSLLTNPTSDSLVTLIDQSLQSGDDGLLEQCLECTDADVVDATAARLPANRVVLLLRKLVAKFEKRPSRGGLLTQWLSSVLRHHTSFLITVPDLSYQLAGLSQMLEQRLSSYVKLAALSGRLDLLMSQVVNPSSKSQQALGSVEPVQVYTEN